jgi:hypothetical protein
VDLRVLERQRLGGARHAHQHRAGRERGPLVHHRQPGLLKPLPINITAGNATCIISAIQLRTSAGGVDQAASQYILERPGQRAASRGCHVGARSFYRTDVSSWDWELFGFTGYSAAQPLGAQPGVSRDLFLPLQNSATPYWFVADGRRVMVVAKAMRNFGVLRSVRVVWFPQTNPSCLAGA